MIDTDVVDSDDFSLDFTDEIPDETPVVDVESEEIEEPSDDSFDFNDMFGDFDMSDDSEEEKPVVADPVDTYTDIDGTEIEVPAPEVPEEGEDDEEKEEEDPAAALADDVIPENFSRKVTKKEMNENRKAILSVKKK